MSRQDRARWDERWAGAGDHYPPHPFLIDHAGHLSGGRALDLACGRGQNAMWLARRGYRVLGVDISLVALGVARQQSIEQGLTGAATLVAADLDEWLPPEGVFDLVVVFRFLDRRLFEPLGDAVRPGGLVYYSTRHLGVLARDRQANRRYLLGRGELAAAFSDWRILHYEEGAVNAGLIARKPA